MNPIIYKRDGKNIGEFDGTTLRKTVNSDKHLFRVLDAWGIDAELLDKILVPKKANIEITDTKTGVVYSISAEYAREHGEFYHFKQAKKDHGTQIFIRRKFFSQNKV